MDSVDDDQNKENEDIEIRKLNLKLRILEEETKREQEKTKQEQEKTKQKDKDLLLEQEKTKQEQEKTRRVETEAKFLVPGTQTNQSQIKQARPSSGNKRKYNSQASSTEGTKSEATSSSFSTCSSRTASNSQSTSIRSTCNESISITSEPITGRRESLLCSIRGNCDFHRIKMVGNIKQFDIDSLLNDYPCLLNDGDYNDNIERFIKNYLEDVQNALVDSQSFYTMPEITLQTAFDTFMPTLLSSFENYTALKYINASTSRYLDGFSPDCSYIFKNVSIKPQSIAKVLENFAICFGELKSSTKGNIELATIGQIGRYLYMLNKTQGWRKIYAYVYDFYTITFFYCERKSDKNELQYYQSETLRLIEDDPVNRSNFDVLTIGNEPKEIYFSKKNWKMLIKFLTMDWQFYDYKMLNIRPSDNLLGKNYKITGRLGSGATSFVYLLKYNGRARKGTLNFCVMKILRKNKLSMNFQREMEIIKKLRGTKCMNSPVFPDILNSPISERCLIFTKRLYHINSWQSSHSMEMIDAVQHLYKNNIIHRDIRPPNVMMDDGEELQLIDFGFAYIFKDNQVEQNLPVEGATTIAGIDFLVQYSDLLENAHETVCYDYQRNFDLFCAINVITYRINKEVENKMNKIHSKTTAKNMIVHGALQTWKLMKKHNRVYKELLESIEDLTTDSDFENIKSILRKNYENLQTINNQTYVT